MHLRLILRLLIFRTTMLSVDIGMLAALCSSLYQRQSNSRYESDECQALDLVHASDWKQSLVEHRHSACSLAWQGIDHWLQTRRQIHQAGPWALRNIVVSCLRSTYNVSRLLDTGKMWQDILCYTPEREAGMPKVDETGSTTYTSDHGCFLERTPKHIVRCQQDQVQRS